MKRKVYATKRERMIYQLIGFLAFPLLNVPLWIILWILSQIASSSWLAILLAAVPWLVNGIVIVLALFLHPEFAVGYVTFIGIAMAVGTALGVLFVAACFVTFLSAVVIGDLAKWVFIFLMAAGVLGIIVLAVYVFATWWSSYKNNLQ